MEWFVAFVFSSVVCLCGCCPDGWTTHGSKCYLFSREVQTWADATIMCQFMKGTLVEIEDSAENTYLQTQGKLRGSENYWIALSDVQEEGTYVWMNSGQHLTGDSFTDWMPGQPNNIDLNQNCIRIEASFQWNDMPCTDTFKYICEQDTSVEIIG